MSTRGDGWVLILGLVCGVKGGRERLSLPTGEERLSACNTNSPAIVVRDFTKVESSFHIFLLSTFFLNTLVKL